MLGPAMYTLEEISRYLKIPIQVVEKAIADGKLLAKSFGGFLRISEPSLTDYLNSSNASPAAFFKAEKIQDCWLHLRPTSDFDHKWPDTTVEHFEHAMEGTAFYEGREYEVKLGFTIREAAGRRRGRYLVLIDRYPTVEFVKEDESNEVGPVAAVIKGRNKKHIPATATPPPEYEGLNVGSYREVVEGPRAAHGLAVICSSHDFETMVKHALIQYRFREESS
jgi:hypothetical protein